MRQSAGPGQNRGKPSSRSKIEVSPKQNSVSASLLILALGFGSGVLSLLVFEKWQEKSEVKRVMRETTTETAWMRVKAFRAPIYREPHRKATPVGMYFKNFHLEIAGKSSDWVKIGPDRFMHLSDLEGIETDKTKKF